MIQRKLNDLKNVLGENKYFSVLENCLENALIEKIKISDDIRDLIHFLYKYNSKDNILRLKKFSREVNNIIKSENNDWKKRIENIIEKYWDESIRIKYTIHNVLEWIDNNRLLDILPEERKKLENLDIDRVEEYILKKFGKSFIYYWNLFQIEKKLFYKRLYHTKQLSPKIYHSGRRKNPVTTYPKLGTTIENTQDTGDTGLRVTNKYIQKKQIDNFRFGIENMCNILELDSEITEKIISFYQMHIHTRLEKLKLRPRKKKKNYLFLFTIYFYLKKRNPQTNLEKILDKARQYDIGFEKYNKINQIFS